jgi:hypothetical protein
LAQSHGIHFQPAKGKVYPYYSCPTA